LIRFARQLYHYTIQARKHTLLNKRIILWGTFLILIVLSILFFYQAIIALLNEKAPSISQKIPFIKKIHPTQLGWEVNSTAAVDGLSDPFGIVIDSSGNFFVAEGGDANRILKITTKGLVSVFAGGAEGFADGQGEQAQFNTPSGLAIDKKNNIYVADTGNNAIRKISSQGLVTTIAGNGQAGYVDGKALQAQLNGPIGVALDKLGQVYVADTYNDKIRMINNQGEVVTVAGSSTGYMDGTALEAQFNTPTGIVINRANEIIVADSYNHAIRKITDQGMVATIAMSERKDSTAIMFKPIGLAITHDDYIYVGESSNGRILQISPLDQLIGLTGVDIDIIPGDDTSIRLKKPFGIAVDQNGELLITDNDQLLILRLRKNTQVAKQQSKISISEFNKPESVKEKSPQLWPLLPQNQVHEVVGTIGEVRGNYQGESRDHFHRGLDIQADMGKSVVVIMDEKVKDPIATWSANTINEGIRLGTMAYIHMKVGRDAKNQNIDSNKFKMKLNPKGQIQQVQVKRGTRFRTGDVIGMVNSMYHVHLNYYVKGDVLNPLVLGFVGFEDNVEPLIFGIEVRDQYDQLLKKLKNKNILTIPRSLEKISIIVDAADQTDGNAARRRLGLYELSYQVLYEDGKPIEGFESPRNTIRFNQLPVDDEAVMVVYASNSGITVHGSARTRFLYNITNEVRNGHAIKGFLDIKNLPLGDYIIRVTVSDYAGNVAKTNRDLPIRIE
jgi:hypothetical protein